MANTSLSGWLGSAEPSMKDIVIPLWQLAPRGKDGSYPRSRSLPNMQTFEEFYASVTGGKSPAGDFRYQAMRAAADPQLAMFRVAAMPPKSPDDVVAAMRSAFDELWKDQDFLADYAKVLATQADHGLGRRRPGHPRRPRQSAAPDQGFSRRLHQPRHREIAARSGELLPAHAAIKWPSQLRSGLVARLRFAAYRLPLCHPIITKRANRP